MVREVTSANWVSYTAEKPKASPVHLLPYPVTVTSKGKVSRREDSSIGHVSKGRPWGQKAALLWIFTELP